MKKLFLTLWSLCAFISLSAMENKTNEDLLKAVSARNVEKVSQLLQAGGNPNYIHWRAPLEEAQKQALKNDAWYCVVNHLRQRGATLIADINAIPIEWSNTDRISIELLAAITQGNIESAKNHLEVDTQYCPPTFVYAETPLILAFHKSPDQKNDDPYQSKVIELLIQDGAQIPKNHVSLLHNVIFQGTDEQIKQLITVENCDVTTHEGKTLLEQAVAAQRIPVIQHLLDLNSQKAVHEDCKASHVVHNRLLYAAINGKNTNPEIVRVLLENGANPLVAQGDEGISPYNRAKQFGLKDIERMMEEHMPKRSFLSRLTSPYFVIPTLVVGVAAVAGWLYYRSHTALVN